MGQNDYATTNTAVSGSVASYALWSRVDIEEINTVYFPVVKPGGLGLRGKRTL